MRGAERHRFNLSAIAAAAYTGYEDGSPAEKEDPAFGIFLIANLCRRTGGF